MPEYRRFYQPGGTYFFTLVTYNRRPLFADPFARKLLHTAWEQICVAQPFETLAICLLPDHLHCVLRLPENDFDYSKRLGRIKIAFTKAYLKQYPHRRPVSRSRLERHEADVWQRRFWEHFIKDEEDLYAHIDYLHYNPVKHGWAKQVSDWPFSSFGRFASNGFYSGDWGQIEPVWKIEVDDL